MLNLREVVKNILQSGPLSHCEGSQKCIFMSSSTLLSDHIATEQQQTGKRNGDSCGGDFFLCKISSFFMTPLFASENQFCVFVFSYSLCHLLLCWCFSFRSETGL